MKKISILLIPVGMMLGSCCNDDFIIPSNYDSRDGAIDITSIMNSCSANAIYSTEGATPDGTVETSSSCQQEPGMNVWFKFTAATGTIWVDILIGDDYGTQQMSVLKLWDSNGNYVDCAAGYPGYSINLSNYPVNSGEQYFLSVDSSTSEMAGTFTLCIADTD